MYRKPFVSNVWLDSNELWKYCLMEFIREMLLRSLAIAKHFKICISYLHELSKIFCKSTLSKFKKHDTISNLSNWLMEINIEECNFQTQISILLAVR